jgi:hypothetical protein
LRGIRFLAKKRSRSMMPPLRLQSAVAARPLLDLLPLSQRPAFLAAGIPSSSPSRPIFLLADAPSSS